MSSVDGYHWPAVYGGTWAVSVVAVRTPWRQTGVSWEWHNGQGHEGGLDHGVLEVEEGFFCNCDSSFYCTRHISIGSEALLGWNAKMNMSNGHRVFDNGVHDTPNTLIAGMPAKDIKNNYSWKDENFHPVACCRYQGELAFQSRGKQ